MKKLEHTKGFIDKQLKDIEAFDGASGNPVLVYIKQLKCEVAFLKREAKVREQSLQHYKKLNDEQEKHLVEQYGLHNFTYREKEKTDPVADKAKELTDNLCEILFSGAYEPSERGAGFTTDDGSVDEAQRLLYDLITQKEKDNA